MKPYIEASHKRCVQRGIKPENLFSTKVIEGTELQEKLEQNKELLAAAAPYMQHLYNFVKGSDFFAILNDAEGCILNVIGDEGILAEANKLKMIPGAYMDEEHVGTNAMSVVLKEGVPVQVSGEEHFINAYHRWTCSAAPIKDTDGRIIGIIDLTGYSENVHSHTLGMVVSAANAIEKMMEIKGYNSMLETSKKHVETIFNSIKSGILTTDLSGNIVTMNKEISIMFGYSDYEMKKMKIWNMIEGWDKIIDKLSMGQVFVDEDVYVNIRKNKLQFTLTAYPIYDSENRIKEIIHIIHELKKSRKLAGKMIGNQAVYTFDKIIGTNKKFIQTIELAKKIADSKSTVLITGESGTGKEVFAQSIHNYSIRNEEPFIAVNCGAIPRTLIESELFGYEEGSFTGAKKGGNIGKFELADGGTIFLDEIGEMPTDMQIKLLRVIEEGVINRIGSANQMPINVRIITATNKNLKEEVEKGNFRKDLYYRLNVLPVHLPPLRERREDIPILINYYMKRISQKLNKRCVYISPEYMSYLQNYDWPGNIRELENVIELIVNTESIHMNLWNREVEKVSNVSKFDSNLTLEQLEKQHIINVINQYQGNITLAAKILDVGRNTLYRKIKKYNIDCSDLEHCSETEQL